MQCPTCQSTRVTGHGEQVVSITEIYVDDDLQEYATDDWHEKLGTWAWDCRTCGHLWNTDEGPRIGGAGTDPRMLPTDLHTTAQWIIETVLAAEQALGDGRIGDIVCDLEAITAWAHNIYEATASKEHADEL